MKCQDKLLFEIYTLFVDKYPLMSYKFENIKFKFIKKSNYVNEAKKSILELELSVKIDDNLLEEFSSCFQAEVFRIKSQAIILIDECFLILCDELHKIILHELAHLYCDVNECKAHFIGIWNGNIIKKNKPNNVTVPQWELFCIELLYGYRCWRELIAEYISWTINPVMYKISHEEIKKEIFEIMLDKDKIPEKVGFFVFKCLIINKHNTGDLLLSETNYNIEKCIVNILEYIKEKFDEETFWRINEEFILMFGKKCFSFLYEVIKINE